MEVSAVQEAHDRRHREGKDLEESEINEGFLTGQFEGHKCQYGRCRDGEAHAREGSTSQP
jgi:hypothetical protein